MAKVLYMVFTDAAGKDFTLRLPEVRTDLTAAEVATAMDGIIATNAIATDNGDITAKKSASIVDTVEQILVIA